jgi:hypothetical protein
MCYEVWIYDGEVLLYGTFVKSKYLGDIKYLVNDCFKVWRVSKLNVRIRGLGK